VNEHFATICTVCKDYSLYNPLLNSEEQIKVNSGGCVVIDSDNDTREYAEQSILRNRPYKLELNGNEVDALVDLINNSPKELINSWVGTFDQILERLKKL
jgi:hypothetical protein